MAKNRIVQGIPAQTDKQIVPLNLRLVDLSGGQNSNTSPSLLDDREARISCGVSYRQRGTIRVQRGRVKRYMTTVANYTTSGLGAYYKRDSKSYFVMIIGNTIYYDRALLNFLYTSSAEFMTGDRNVVDSIVPIDWGTDSMRINNYWRACLLMFASGQPYPYVPIDPGTGLTVGYSITPKKTIVVNSITMQARYAGIDTTEHLFKVSVWKYSTEERVASQSGTAYSWNHSGGQVDFIAEFNPQITLEANTEYIISCYTVTGEMYEWTINSGNTQHYDDFTWTPAHNMSSTGDNFPKTTSRSNKYLRGLYLNEYDIADVSLDYNSKADFDLGTYTNSAYDETDGRVEASGVLTGQLAPLTYTGETLTGTVRYETDKVKLQTDASYWALYQDLTWAELQALVL